MGEPAKKLRSVELFNGKYQEVKQELNDSLVQLTDTIDQLKKTQMDSFNFSKKLNRRKKKEPVDDKQ